MSTEPKIIPLEHGVCEVDVWFLPAAGEAAVLQKTRVVEEAMISIDVADVGWYTLMWTPTASTAEVLGFTANAGVMAATDDPEVFALAAGFLFTEGVIEKLSDIQKMEVCATDASIVRVALVDPAAVQTRRKNVVMGSSCGVCGGRDAVENIAASLRPVGATLTLNARQFSEVTEAMRKLQTIFEKTGGAHCAAVFDRDSRIVAVAEDLGRHNALDKVIGQCLLRGVDPRGCAVLLSSRLSLEMVSKAVRAGFEVVAAVSAPTSLAIEIGARFDVTLCGFVRGGRATIYSHPRRIADVQ